ncbi:hypothetical protein DVH05_008689 [Phytophthora capsici]|nr:hypothetical protein DVH05_015185 [Phytophthora capsici]KAG1706817.1 hypothetical protein DVH05_027669 [Phytophthora capsici]KAG1711437.1 hypothetical protein DVH05_008689 [Phytophthora capsici]
MDGKSLARELIRARTDELVQMKDKVEKMNISLDKLLRAQLDLLSIIEENEERSFALSSELWAGGHAQGGTLSFGVLLEMVISRLKE